jgi:CRP-like cAMP-binding protein
MNKNQSIIPPSLAALFKSIGELTPEAEADVELILENKIFSKKEIILRTGEICRHIYFIDTGMARSFYIDEGKEVTGWFMAENDVIISVKSFFLQAPSEENLQALEELSLYFISFENLQMLYAKHPSFSTIGRRLTEYYYIKSEERLQNIRKKDAFDRYKFLLSYHPGIFQRVSNRTISSYLNITEETLSRLRAKKLT